MKHKRDDGAEKQDEETVDVTPIMICVFVVMCCSMLVLLYFFYDYLGTVNTLAQHTFKPGASMHMGLMGNLCTIPNGKPLNNIFFKSCEILNAKSRTVHQYLFILLTFCLTSDFHCAAIWVIAIFCVASSVGLHSCLWPFVKRLPFCKCR